MATESGSILEMLAQMRAEQKAVNERIEARLAELQTVSERIEARLIALEVKRQHASPVLTVTTPRVTLPTPPSWKFVTQYIISTML